jgi:putative DNA primase/helicase
MTDQAPIDLSEERSKRAGWGDWTDLGNAERFVKEHKHHVRYCVQKKKWLLYREEDGRWSWDTERGVQRRMHETVRGLRKIAAEWPNEKERDAIWYWAKQSESTGKINAALESAQPYLIVQPDELDADPWLLCVANGVLDLHTGTLLEHDRKYLMTRRSPAVYVDGATSDIWQAYLDTATAGDKQLQAFLMRVAGYWLTGSTREKCFFMLYGPKDTGKSVFVEALSTMLGDYAQSSDFDSWCVQKYAGGNRGDLVRLAGSRLVSAVETNEGAKFDSARIKGITGGERIVAAAKFEAETEFLPHFKLLFAVNDCPRISEGDDAMFGRVRRIPWQVVIPTEKQDPNLRDKLAEPETLSAILAWCTQGLKEYVQMGQLGTCKAVEDSNAQYRSENDITREFLEECLDWHQSYRCPANELRAKYESWCRTQGIKHPLSAQKLALKLERKGAEIRRIHGGRMSWFGFRCFEDSDGPDLEQWSDGEVGEVGEANLPRRAPPQEPRGSIGENTSPGSPASPATTLELFQQDSTNDANIARGFCPACETGNCLLHGY